MLRNDIYSFLFFLQINFGKTVLLNLVCLTLLARVHPVNDPRRLFIKKAIELHHSQLNNINYNSDLQEMFYYFCYICSTHVLKQLF